MTSTLIKLTKAEIQKKIPYALISKTMESTLWGTEQRKQAWEKTFTKEEQIMCERMGRTAQSWSNGKMPESYITNEASLALWQRLAEFCTSVE